MRSVLLGLTLLGVVAGIFHASPPPSAHDIAVAIAHESAPKLHSNSCMDSTGGYWVVSCADDTADLRALRESKKQGGSDCPPETTALIAERSLSRGSATYWCMTKA